MEKFISSTRIAKNTCYLYFRMLFKILVTLYTSRVILDVIGIQDFGIYNVVAGVVALLGFVNSSMAISVQRYLSFEIGRGGSLKQLNTIFSMAVVIHLLIALIVVAGTEILGKYLFEYLLNIPPDRYDSAYILFHFTILTCGLSIIQVPYMALLISHERMNAYAYIGILEMVLRLVAVYALLGVSYDKLPCYGFFLLLIGIIVSFLYYYCAKKQISQIRVTLTWNKKIFKDLLNFASWSALGEFAWAGTGQGVNILLNVFFSPVVNAARAVAQQVISGIMQFVINFQTAINPQIVKSYAAGETRKMMILTNKGILYSYYLLLMMSFPILINIDFVLGIWLKNVPLYSNVFCTLAIIGAMIDSLSNLLATVAKAYGKIRNYQLAVSLILFLNLLFSYIALKFGAPAYAVYWVYLGVSFFLLIARLLLLKRMVAYDIKSFVLNVLLKILVVTAIAIPLPIIVKHLLPDSWSTFVYSTLLSLLCISSVVFTVGIGTKEKNLIKHKILFILRR